jgi:hypothetical protein
MRPNPLIILTAIALGFTLPAAADEKPGHDHAAKAGPTGGRLITTVEPHVEFLVSKEKRVEIRFVDEANKVVAPAAQVITITMGDRSRPTKLSFTRDGDKLVSDKPIPEGNNHPTVVQIKADAKAKPVNARFNLNLTECPGCSRPEYACTCDHDHDHDEKEGQKKPR